MKIKTKKQFTLPQLIEWAQDNIEEATKKVYRVNENEVLGNHVRFTEVYSDLEVRLHGYIPFDTTFTVEVEEEITEDTKLDFLLDHFINPYGQHYVGDIHHNRSINDVLEENDEMEIATNSIHLFDKETKEFKLIWRDGKLVE